MTTYNTGNPIGSTDARDLYDNAQNLDNFANGTAASYTDRLGVPRRSLSGIDAAADNVLNSIGYAVPVAYAPGISLTLTSQTVDYNGVVYAPKSSALPFTTSSWGTDSAKFRAVQVTDSAYLSYAPAGTGAVATTVQSKLREAVSVKDFGAVGDGVADDTAEIQAAVSWAISNNAWVQIPAGTYKVTSQIVIDTRTAAAGTFKLFGKGATLSVPGGNIAALNTTTFTDLSNTASTGGLVRVLTPDSDSHSCFIEGLRFYKPDTAYPTRYGTFINVSTQRNVHISDCVFSGGYDIGILFTPTYGASIERCSITGFNTGIWCRGGINGINITNNSIRNGRRGIRVSSHTASDTNVNVRITNNILESLTDDAIQFQGVRASVIANNYFESVDQDGATYYADTGDYSKKVCIYFGVGQDSNVEASARNYIYGNYGWTAGALNILIKSGFGNVLVANNGIDVLQATADSIVLDTNGKLAIETLSERTPNSGISVVGRIKQENAISVSAFENSWVNTDVAYFGPARYWRDAFGNVHLEGNIKNGSLNTAAFTLPAGYRPQYEMQLPTSSANAFGQIRISTNGQVIPRVGGTTDVNLNGIVFRAYGY